MKIHLAWNFDICFIGHADITKPLPVVFILLCIFRRLRGNYEALDSGKLQVALVDMTGGLGEVIEISDKGEIPDNLYDLMWKSSQMNSMLGASIHVSAAATE